MKGSRDYDIWKRSLGIQTITENMIVAPWHFEQWVRNSFRGKNWVQRGIVSAKSVLKSGIPQRHYLPSAVAQSHLQIVPINDNEHMSLALKEYNFYSAAIQNGLTTRKYVAEVISGQVKVELFFSTKQIMQLYSNKRMEMWMELQNCRPHQTLVLLAKAYSPPTKNKAPSLIPAGLTTIRGAIEHVSVYRPDKQTSRENALSYGQLPLSFCDRSKTRFGKGTAKEQQQRKIKKNVDLEKRLAATVQCTPEYTEQTCAVAINMNDETKFRYALVPLCYQTNTYDAIRVTTDTPSPPELLYLNTVEKSFVTTFKQLLSKKSGTVIYQSLDPKGVAGFKSKMMFQATSDILLDHHRQRLNQLDVGQNNKSVLVQIACTLEHDRHAQRIAESNSIRTIKPIPEKYKLALETTINMILSIKEGMIAYLPKMNPDRVPTLERIPWITWSLVSNRFIDFVPEWQRITIKSNHRKIGERIRKKYPDASQDELVSHFHNAVLRAEFFHVSMILAISQVMEDNQTQSIYCQLMGSVYDVESYFEQMKEFGDDGFKIWYRCQVEICRRSSLSGARVHTLILTALTHLFYEFPTGIDLRSIAQISEKKESIINSTMAVFTGDLTNVKTGVDIHVQRGICSCIRASLAVKFNSEIVNLIFDIADNLPVEIAVIANEMFGTVGQILNRGNEVNTEFLDFVLERIKGKSKILAVALELWETQSTGITKYVSRPCSSN